LTPRTKKKGKQVFRKIRKGKNVAEIARGETTFHQQLLQWSTVHLVCGRSGGVWVVGNGCGGKKEGKGRRVKWRISGWGGGSDQSKGTCRPGCGQEGCGGWVLKRERNKKRLRGRWEERPGERTHRKQTQQTAYSYASVSLGHCGRILIRHCAGTGKS